MCLGTPIVKTSPPESPMSLDTSTLTRFDLKYCVVAEASFLSFGGVNSSLRACAVCALKSESFELEFSADAGEYLELGESNLATRSLSLRVLGAHAKLLRVGVPLSRRRVGVGVHTAIFDSGALSID